MPVIITPNSREHWLELRREDVTSTESAALFGLSPYATEFELFHRKLGNVSDEIEQNERMTWGLRLQDAIAHGVAEDMGLTVRRINGYWRHTDEPRMGASFDFEIVSHADGPGLMEVKNVDGRVYREQWLDDEAPPHIEIQVQHQLEVANREWALIVCLVAGNTPRVIRVARDRQVGDKLRAAIRRFWQRVDANTPPAVDFVQDADTIREIYRNGSGAPLDATGNNRLHSLALSYASAARDEKDAVARKEAARSEMLTLIGDAGKVTGEGWTLTATETKGSAGTTITPDMVGTVIGARSGYRQFRLNLKEVA
jgi:putative phage-type endonuclease